jgi:hypothetical protein
MGMGILPSYGFGSGGGSGSITGTLSGLSDVSITSPVSAQLLSFGNAGKWVNTNLTNIPAFVTLQAQVNSISVSGYTPLATTAALTGALQSQISSEITNRQLGDQNLQQQINEVVAGSHVVFSEQLTGNGISTHYQLTGAITNGQFISGGWAVINVLSSLESNITDVNGKPIYDAGILSLFTRHRIYIDSIDLSGGVNLDYAPQNSQVFKLWYWYDLQGTDRINNYYRDDFVAKMEQNDGDLATNVVANIVNFNNILSNTDNTVQKALETLDDHTHPEIASISASVINLGNTKQNNITLIGGANVSIVQAPAATWTISVTGVGSASIAAGTGISVTPSGAVSVIAVVDYIGKTEVAAISASLDSRIQLVDASVVHLTGNESISGSKNFAQTPSVSGLYTVLHTGNAFYEHYQATPSSLWIVAHNLNRHPSVTTTNLSGYVIIGDVTYINNNIVTISVQPARAGYAYFN